MNIHEKSPERTRVITSLNNLATLHYKMGDFTKAELRFQRALEMREKTLGPEHPDLALSLNNLALLYKEKGDYAKAEPLYLRVLEIRKQHPDLTLVATSLNNIGLLYVAKGEYPKAEPLLQQALEIREQKLPSHDTLIAQSLGNLADLYRLQGGYQKAEPLFRRALTMYEKRLGPNHPLVADLHNNLGLLYKEAGDYAKAGPLLERALEIYEKILGPEHPDFIRSLINNSFFYQVKRDIPQALAFLSRASQARERDFMRNLVSGSERQKLLYISQSAYETRMAISLHINLAPKNKEALRLAVETGLRRKGRAPVVPPTQQISGEQDASVKEDGIELAEPGRSPARRIGLYIAVLLIAATMVFFGLRYFKSESNERAGTNPPAEARERTLSHWALAQKYTGKKPVGEPVRLIGGEMYFHTGDELKLFVTSADAGHLYILSEEPTKNGIQYNLLFPTPKANDSASYIKANAEIATDWTFFEGSAMTEKVWVIWSASPIDQLESEIEKWKSPRYLGEIKDTTTVTFIRTIIEENLNTKLQVEQDEANRRMVVKGKGDTIVRALSFTHL